MNMSHLTISKRSNMPDGTFPTYVVPSASFPMTGGTPRGCHRTTPFAVPLYYCVTPHFPFPTFVKGERAGQQPVGSMFCCFTATRSNRLLVNPSSITDGDEPTGHSLFNSMLNFKITNQ